MRLHFVYFLLALYYFWLSPLCFPYLFCVSYSVCHQFLSLSVCFPLCCFFCCYAIRSCEFTFPVLCLPSILFMYFCFLSVLYFSVLLFLVFDCLVCSSFVLILLLSTYILYMVLVSLGVSLFLFYCILSPLLSLLSGLRSEDGLVLLLCIIERKWGVLSY